MKKLILVLLVVIGVCGMVMAGEGGRLPVELGEYGEIGGMGKWEALVKRVEVEPFNLVATGIFLLAVVHTFLAVKIMHWAHRLERKQKEGEVSLWRRSGVRMVHLLGEVEVVFGLWAVPLVGMMWWRFGWGEVVSYFGGGVSYQEAVFVVVIMAVAGTKPVLGLATRLMSGVAGVMGGGVGAWWLVILTLAPLMGSFITEPAAMTIGALLLGERFYGYGPSRGLAYGTLGLLFVNVSIGGTLTHFAAPPVLMVAGKWGWTTGFILGAIGWKSVIAIVVSNIGYYMVYRREFREMGKVVSGAKEVEGEEGGWWVTLVNVGFMVWTVMNLHHTVLVVGGFLFFLGFMQMTREVQGEVNLRTPVMVGFFLGGLVTHGVLQQWWIQPLLVGMGKVSLFSGAAVLTSFNDNAAITYLVSLVPELKGEILLQKMVVAGAVAGGGLTVIANAPNPAGQSLLSRYFHYAVSPLYVFIGALPATLVTCLIYVFFI